MEKTSKIYVAGHRGLVGSAIVRKLLREGYNNLVLKTREELDLTDQKMVEDFFDKEKPEYVFLAAAKVGGIHANRTYPAEFLYQNLMIESNVIHASYKYGVKKLLFLGSSCIYPRECPQPIKEEYLLSGYLEQTNEAYAIAKIAGLKLCQYYKKQYGANFISCMPTNLYGPYDNFDLETSHVIPALVRKFHEAKVLNKPEVEVWGTGKVLREFLYVDDLADACVFLMNYYDGDMWINVGSGEEVSIEELANIIKEVTGYEGKIVFNPKMPDGTPRKLLDCSRLKELGWLPKTNLREGLRMTYDWYLKMYCR
ncbi:NAD-dependent epimerase/dehydratase [Caldicellulosiruptor acetigenus I77R1B]|jgi:GDP-L-fucose synthase|uniref:GDP-L-fucose synthase n=1 Tax=Caldicellulosiruptor acetigenus (strain ATCC 700853 / DSM 12137 / I77R1B) TaxID=632335 RepID=E4S7Y3_CALA7|nr:GDP-L-fucose synthase [Caldicellulosiruptor acetigenus]ADQ41883.1 NAD-dependent epimerase/dehydratase [Caldicellulosiruptor acetigenus I77R1B]